MAVAVFSAAKQPQRGWRFFNQVKNNVFFRISSILATRSHAGLIFCTVNRTLWAFFGAWGRDRSQSPPCWKNVDFFGWNKYSNPRPQWGRHSYCLTNKHESLHKWCVNAGRLSAKLGHHQARIASAPRVFWDTAAPYFSKYRLRVALYSAYRQRVGDTSSVAAAKLSVSARHAKRAWLEPWTLNSFCKIHGDRRVFHFAIIINVLVSSFWFIWIPMLCYAML